MSMIKPFIIFFSVVLFTNVIHSQEKPFSLDELKWLSGQWKGEAFGGVAEEIWSKPSSNSMMGMFRLQYDNVDKLYEFLLIEQSGSGISMKFKHIKSGYDEMENEPILLNLIELNSILAHFENEDKSLIIKYNLLTENSVKIELISTKNGKTEVTPILMKKS
ncbi:MAG: DUF6265 family protein [Ignavibacteriaceae bacterium]